jgi:hypothetical protein
MFKRGDLVKQCYDSYNDGPAVIVGIDPKVVFPNGQIANARYQILYLKNGKKDWAIDIALELVSGLR